MSLKSLADCKGLEEDIGNLWELSRNISKAQELFLVKLLEMDMVRVIANKSTRFQNQSFATYYVASRSYFILMCGLSLYFR